MNAQTTTKHAVEFETRYFEASHGKSPRGFGNWGFCPAHLYHSDNYLSHVVWFDGRSYGDAKKLARAHFSTVAGAQRVAVCS